MGLVRLVIVGLIVGKLQHMGYKGRSTCIQGWSEINQLIKDLALSRFKMRIFISHQCCTLTTQLFHIIYFQLCSNTNPSMNDQ